MHLPHKNESLFNVDFHEFEEKVIQASRHKPVLVDLWAEWCTPCLVIAPVLKKLIEHNEGRLLLAKVEVDEGENMKVAGHYRVRGFPAVILFSDGVERGRFHGARPLSFIQQFVDAHIDSV